MSGHTSTISKSGPGSPGEPVPGSPGPSAPRRRGRWLPGQHGAWAMLLVPLLVGIAVSRPSPWHIVLTAAAASGYLVSATIQAWARARRAPAYRLPILVYGATFGCTGLALVAAFPRLILTLVVVVPATVVVLRGARPGTRRDLANSLAQVAQALVLVPAAVEASGTFELRAAVVGTGVAAGYLVGTVLVVRSVLRERGSSRSAAISIGFHIGLAALAIAVLPATYGWLAAALALRAAVLPIARRRLAGSSRPLRPIHVGLVELAASVAVVGAAFAVPA